MTDVDVTPIHKQVEPGGTLTVGVDEVFALRLNDKATAGYLWTVEAPPVARDVGKVRLTGPDPDAVGGFHDVLHLFAIGRTGTHVFVVSEAQPWVGGGDRLEITVEVA